MGERDASAKPLKGFGGAKVLEIVAFDERSSTYRTVYTVEFEDAVYVLHVFQKKSKSGIATPKRDVDLVAERLRQARRIHADRG